jgi:hypothetical protein
MDSRKHEFENGKERKLKVRKMNRTTASAAGRRQLPVVCFYCDERFRRTQDRATHIRHYHPGRPYRPDLDKERNEAVVLSPGSTPSVKLAVSDVGLARPKIDDRCSDSEMTSKQHLVAAISSIKRRQEEVAKQMPELERQVGELRAAQKQMDTERQALETALAAISVDTLEQVQESSTVANSGN